VLRTLLATAAISGWGGLILNVSASALADGKPSPVGFAVGTGFVIAITIVLILPPALLGYLLRRPWIWLDILTGGKPSETPTRRRWMWFVLFPVGPAAAYWITLGQARGRLDLPVDTAILAAAGGGLAFAWLLHAIIPRLTSGLSRLGAVPLSLAVATTLFAAWFVPLPRVAAEWIGPAFPLVVVGAALVVAATARAVPESKRRIGLIVGFVLTAGFLGAAWLGPVAAATSPSTSLVALRAARWLADRDGDGFSSLFGGGDCDDSDAGVHPFAIELVGNQRDDNCLSGDLETPAALPESHPATTASSERPDVVLITIDAFRADRFTAELTPNLWAYGEQGLVFARAYAAAPFTNFSLTALFTGWPPLDFDFHSELVGLDRPLASLFSDAGWQTYGLHSLTDFDDSLVDGFQFMSAQLSELHATPIGSSAAELCESALELLASPGDGSPRFLWLHLLDPHLQYLPHAGFEELGNSLAGRYGQEVAFTDAALGPLLDWLSRPEIAARTVVAITADHGEYLGEQGGRVGHGNSLYEEVLHVPLILRAPGTERGARDESVGLVDILPTMLELAGIAGVEPRAGHSLLRPPPENRALLGVGSPFGGGPLPLSIRRGRWFLNCYPADQRCELFNLEADPTALVDVSSDEPEQLAEIRAELHRLIDRYHNDARIRARHISWQDRARSK
jgi:hypothetical protein